MAEINSILDLSALARGRRQALGLSQEELAVRANVSRQWISAFEFAFFLFFLMSLSHLVVVVNLGNYAYCDTGANKCGNQHQPDSALPFDHDPTRL